MLGAILLSTLAAATPASAHQGCGGHEGLGRRNELITGPAAGSAKFAKRQDVTIDTAGCEGYYYPPASALVPSYPTTWQTATILPSDTAAQSAYSAISAKLASSFPQDVPHGQPNGDWSGVSYNGGQDPDCWWTYTTCTSPKAETGLDPDVTIVPEPGSYGLTVDDGPNCNNGFFYDYFKQNNYTATLFYIGSNVLNWPYQGMRGIEDGHEICVHTWSHQYMTALTNEQVFAELYYTRKIIKDLLNVTATCWRPPYGDVDNRVRLVAKELGLKTIIWSEDTDDWSEGSGTPPAKIDANYQAIIDKQTNNSYGGIGPIVLAHELSNFTMNEMIKYLPAIKAAFAHVIPVAVAYNQTTPYVEQDIIFPTFEQFIGGDEKVVTTSLASTSASGSASATSTTAASSASTTTTGTVQSAGSNSNKNNAGDGAVASAKPSSAAVHGVSGSWMMGAVVGIAGAALAL